MGYRDPSVETYRTLKPKEMSLTEVYTSQSSQYVNLLDVFKTVGEP